jgi:hypothetical protein
MKSRWLDWLVAVALVLGMGGLSAAEHLGSPLSGKALLTR